MVLVDKVESPKVDTSRKEWDDESAVGGKQLIRGQFVQAPVAGWQ
jgi:hypothetical protein